MIRALRGLMGISYYKAKDRIYRFINTMVSNAADMMYMHNTHSARYMLPLASL